MVSAFLTLDPVGFESDRERRRNSSLLLPEHLLEQTRRAMNIIPEMYKIYGILRTLRELIVKEWLTSLWSVVPTGIVSQPKIWI